MEYGNALFRNINQEDRGGMSQVLLQKQKRLGNYPSHCNLVGREGFEPSTNGLRVRCSTN
jgi:hypothetical protein